MTDQHAQPPVVQLTDEQFSVVAGHLRAIRASVGVLAVLAMVGVVWGLLTFVVYVANVVNNS